ncbi:MAG: alpha-amylase family protein [Infirmifilum sp.]
MRRRFTRVLQFNFEDAEGFGVDKISGAAIVDLAARLNVNTLVVFARDAWGRAFYDSNIAPKIPKLGGRDLVKEVVEEAKKRNIDVVAMIGHTTNPYLYNRHPEWAQRDREGNLITMDTDPLLKKREKPSWPLMCLNSPFSKHVLDEVDEVLEYDVSGVFLDSFRYMPDADRACFCKYCRELFKSEMGYELPDLENLDSQAYRDAFAWRVGVNVRRIAEVKARMNSRRPGLILAYNNHPMAWRGRANTISELSKDHVDIFFAECSEADYEPPGFIAEMVKLTKALTGKEVWASRNSFHTTLTTQPTSPLAIRMGLREAFAGGGRPLLLVFASTFLNGLPIEPVREVFDEIEKIEDYMVGARPLAYVGVVWSNRSRDWSGLLGQHLADGFRGFYYALLKEGMPVNYISDTMLDEGRFTGYKAVVLENVKSLSKKASLNLVRYVESGGGLIASYTTGMMDEKGERLDESRLSEVLGLRFNGVLKSAWSYIEVTEPEHPLFRGIPTRNILLGDFDKDFLDSRVPPELGWNALVEAEAPAIARIAVPHREFGNEYENGRSPPPPTVGTIHPAVIAGERWVYFSGQPGRVYWRNASPNLHALILNAILYVAGPPPIQAMSPGLVELEPYYTGDNLLAVHLLNHNYADRFITRSNTCRNSAWTSTADAVHPPTRIVPVNVWLTLRGIKPRRVYSPLTEKDYSVESDGEVSRISVPLQEYEFIVIEPDG